MIFLRTPFAAAFFRYSGGFIHLHLLLHRIVADGLDLQVAENGVSQDCHYGQHGYPSSAAAKEKKMKEMERITTNEWRGDRDSDSKYVIPKELPTAIVTVESRRRR